MSRVAAIARVTDRRGKRHPLANPVSVFVRPLRLGGAGPLRRRLLHTAAYLWLAVRNRRRQRPAQASDVWRLTDAPRFDERIAVFSDAATAGFDFIAERTPPYLNWRYADRRAGDFAMTLAEAEGTILGYSVLRCGTDRAYIADLLALPGRPDVASSLLAEAVRRAVATGVADIECWLPLRHPYRSLIDAAGFFRARNAGVYFEPMGVPEEWLTFLDDPAAAVHVTLGDSDLV